MISLKDKNIILTGSTGGIGMSILEKLVNCGANILSTGTNEDKLKKIEQKYSKVITKKFNISNHNQLSQDRDPRLVQQDHIMFDLFYLRFL